MNHYQTIYVSNVLEGFYRSYDRLSKEEKNAWYQYDFHEANRALLYGSDNKVVITSYPINSQHLQFMRELMGWQNVTNVYSAQPTPALSHDLLSGALYAKLVNLIRENPGIALIQYRATPEFQQLVNALKKAGLQFTTPELADEKNEFAVNYFNSKRGFRHLWSCTLGVNRTDINLPEGFIVADVEEAIKAAWWFKQHNRSWVVKYNRGVQGMGVVLCRANDFSNSQPAFEQQLQVLLTGELWQEGAIVVEELIEPDAHNLGGSPNVEMRIEENGEVVFSYPCEQILEDGKKFIGVYIHPELLRKPQMVAAKQAAEKLGQALSSYGYRGCFDLDLVVDKQGKVFAVEANLRRTGGTHAHEAALALLGANYWEHYHVYILDLHLSQPVEYDQILTSLAGMWVKGKGESGILLANPDLLSEKVFVPLIIAKSRVEIEQLNQEMKRRLAAILA